MALSLRREDYTYRQRESGAGDRIRIRDIDPGKVALYRLSYSRRESKINLLSKRGWCQISVQTKNFSAFIFKLVLNFLSP